MGRSGFAQDGPRAARLDTAACSTSRTTKATLVAHRTNQPVADGRLCSMWCPLPPAHRIRRSVSLCNRGEWCGARGAGTAGYVGVMDCDARRSPGSLLWTAFAIRHQDCAAQRSKMVLCQPRCANEMPPTVHRCCPRSSRAAFQRRRFRWASPSRTTLSPETPPISGDNHHCRRVGSAMFMFGIGPKRPGLQRAAAQPLGPPRPCVQNGWKRSRALQRPRNTTTRGSQQSLNQVPAYNLYFVTVFV